MYAEPGKKLLFMGGEFGQLREWNHDESLDWHLLQLQNHQDLKQWVRDLNHVLRSEPALHELDFDRGGFEWIGLDDWEQSVMSFIRKSRSTGDEILIVCNFTPVPRLDYRVGVDGEGRWQELLSSDARRYGGSGMGNFGGVDTSPAGSHGRSDNGDQV